jgi:sterol desaturase/sphingolipid hydroxylase (fatty acid hydroxylase superfamily)
MDDVFAQWQTVVALGGLTLFLVWESLAPFFLHAGRLRHGVRNLAVAAVNAVLIMLVITGLITFAASESARLGTGLLHLVSLPAALHAVLAFLILDAWMYWWHRLNHRVPFLWRFHRMHHSDPAMDVTTANRFHPGEILLSAGLRIALVFAAGIPLTVVLVYDLVQSPLIAFHHANIHLPPAADRLIRFFIVSPFMHKVHHSRIQAETDSNYTSVLSVWDRLFGSYRESPSPRSIRFGLDGMDGEVWQNVPGMLSTPVRS